ncbi:MAG: hypothetical protein R6X07_07320 [Desulfatiglandales bacterium]
MEQAKEKKPVNGIDVEQSSHEGELVWMAQKYSPVFNMITKSAPVSVHLES